jgi:hypothetical protein
VRDVVLECGGGFLSASRTSNANIEGRKRLAGRVAGRSQEGGFQRTGSLKPPLPVTLPAGVPANRFAGTPLPATLAAGVPAKYIIVILAAYWCPQVGNYWFLGYWTSWTSFRAPNQPPFKHQTSSGRRNLRGSGLLWKRVRWRIECKVVWRVWRRVRWSIECKVVWRVWRRVRLQWGT